MTTGHLGRDAKDFAIEFGGYLANSAEAFMTALSGPDCCDAVTTDCWNNLRSSIFEFRKRAARVTKMKANLKAEQDAIKDRIVDYLRVRPATMVEVASSCCMAVDNAYALLIALGLDGRVQPDRFYKWKVAVGE